MPDLIAGAAEWEPGSEVVIRRRVLRDPETRQVAEIGASYLPVSIVGGTYLEEPTVVPKALFMCVEELAGKPYAHAIDVWRARVSTPSEAELLGLGSAAGVVHLVHVARAADGTVLEVSESVWAADRVEIVDDYEIAQEPTFAHPVPDLRSEEPRHERTH